LELSLSQLKKWVTNTKTYIRVVLTAILQGFWNLVGIIKIIEIKSIMPTRFQKPCRRK
jgi:hypothetical protein